MGEVVFDLVDGHFDGFDLFLGAFDVEFGDFADGFFGEFEDVVAGDVAFEVLLVGAEGAVHVVDLFVPREAVALFHLLVDAFFEEYFFEGYPVPTVFEFGELYL